MTREYLNTLFEYKEGDIFWKMKPAKQIEIGSRAGGIHVSGYRRVRVSGKKVGEHTVIYMMFKGSIPEGMCIDHIDNNPLNNKIENLRLATKSQNALNSKTRVTNKTGVKGICWKPRDNRWVAQIQKDGKKIHIGNFRDLDSAKDAYKKTAIELHGEFVNY